MSGPQAGSPPVAEELGDFTPSGRRLPTLVPAAMVIGVVAAFVAVALLDLIGFFTNLFYYGRISFSFAAPAGNALGLVALAIPVAGGIIVGLMARFGSERIRGHGIPEALEAILVNRSKIEPKVTVLKPVATAVSIGTGGPFGAEGPIIMTGGSFGSLFAQFLRVSAHERKTLLVAGAAAGMAAVFNSPLAALLLAVELLLFELKPRSLIPVGAAVATATARRWTLLGSDPLFPIPMSALPSAFTLVSALVIGLIAGVASMLLTRAVYASEDTFRRLPIHWMWWPAIGGAVIGIGGLIEPRALGVGYPSIDALLLAQLGLSVVLGLLIVKAVIWSVSLGSGTSGGVLAPLLLIGGALGALLAPVLPGGSIGLFALLGMAAMIGGTMRVPFTGIVFALELTHDLPAILPLLVAALVAETVTVETMKRSILTEKVARRGVHVSREYSVDPLERVPVRAVMRRTVRAIPADLTVEAALATSAAPDASETGLTLVEEDGRTVGFVAREDLRVFVDLGGDPQTPVRRRSFPIGLATFPDEPMRIAADRLAGLDGLALPVVDTADVNRVIGFVTREGPFEARVLWGELDHERERILSFPGTARWRGRRGPAEPAPPPVGPNPP
jgi:chloride channel protein, CIC family